MSDEEYEFERPTTKLRFVEREVPCVRNGVGYLGGSDRKTIRVLQQQWESAYPRYTEWRDVPLEKE